IAVSAAFALILWPFFGAILWGTVLAILFAPLRRRLTGTLRNNHTMAVLATLLIVVVLVIVPVTFLIVLLVQEASDIYQGMREGDMSFASYLRQILDVLPAWAVSLLERFGLTDVNAIQARISAGLARMSQVFALQALNVGQNTLEFLVSLAVMLYLLFFLLRDGDEVYMRVRAALPLRTEHQRELSRRFTVVVRATMKGNVVVAVVQGALGGLVFWFLGVHAPLLWAALMAFLSLLPAVGPALVWLPVALYFLAAGALWQGVVLIAFGVFVIGLVDNVLRPILVGKDARLPDYVVLISTLGGMAVFGPNGFVLGPLIAAMFIAGWDLFAASRTGSG